MEKILVIDDDGSFGPPVSKALQRQHATKQAMEAVRRSHQEFNDIFDNAPLVFTRLTPRGAWSASTTPS